MGTPDQIADTQETSPLVEHEQGIHTKKKRPPVPEEGHYPAKRPHVDPHASTETLQHVPTADKSHSKHAAAHSEPQQPRGEQSASPLSPAQNPHESAASEDKGDAGSTENPQSSYAGSSGEEADVDTCSGGSGEAAARRLHKRRAAVVCQDGHVPPAVHQHEGDCIVASKLLALWNATPIAGKTFAVVAKGARRAEGAKAAATLIC